MSCPWGPDRAFDFLYELLENGERREFESHLAGCAACRERVEQASDQRDLLAPPPAPALPRGLADRVLRHAAPRRRPWLRVAAAAALLALVLGLWMLVRPEEEILWVTSAGRERVAPGRVLATAGEPGAVEFPDGSRLVLSPHSRARVALRGRRTAVLELGEAACTIVSDPERFVLSTPAASVAVLGTEFRAQLTGETDMKRVTAAASTGLLLTVAVVAGTVIVSNEGGEVALHADEMAAVRPGEPPRRVTDADLERIADETRRAAAEADDLQARAAELRRVGQMLLLERQRQPRGAAPPAAPAKPAPGRDLDAFMKAQMKAGMKTALKGLVDKLDGAVQLTPEQREQVAAVYEKEFDRIIDLMAQGDFEALEREGGALAGQSDDLKRILRPDQQTLYQEMMDKEKEAKRQREEAEHRKAFHAAAAELGLSDAQRASLEPVLSRPLGSLSEKGAKLFMRTVMGQLPADRLKTEQQGLVQEMLDQVKDRLDPAQLEALRKHAERQLSKPNRIILGGGKEEQDK